MADKTGEKPNIYQRINAIMADVAYVQKENKKVNNQYTFVSHDAVTAAVQPYLVKNGVVVVPSVLSHNQNGNRTEVDVQVDFVNIDCPDDRLSVQFFGYGIDPQDKGPGKAFSYAKKYAFLQVFCLETGDDPERDSIDHKPASGEVKKGGSQNKDWAGPLNKKQLWEKHVEFSDAIKDATNLDDCKAVTQSDEFKAYTEQAEQDWPGLLSGYENGGQWEQGTRETYRLRIQELMQFEGAHG